MSPTDTAKAPAGAWGSCSKEIGTEGPLSTPSRRPEQAKYQEACRRLHRRLDDLDVIDVWKRDLEQRVARAQLKFAYVDCLTGEYDELADEVADFRQICFALGGKSAA